MSELEEKNKDFTSKQQGENSWEIDKATSSISDKITHIQDLKLKYPNVPDYILPVIFYVIDNYPEKVDKAIKSLLLIDKNTTDKYVFNSIANYLKENKNFIDIIILYERNQFSTELFRITFFDDLFQIYSTLWEYWLKKCVEILGAKEVEFMNAFSLIHFLSKIKSREDLTKLYSIEFLEEIITWDSLWFILVELYNKNWTKIIDEIKQTAELITYKKQDSILVVNLFYSLWKDISKESNKYINKLSKLMSISPNKVGEIFGNDVDINYSELKSLQKFIPLYSEYTSKLIKLAKEKKEKVTTLLKNYDFSYILKKLNIREKKLTSKSPHEQLWYNKDWVKSESLKNSIKQSNIIKESKYDWKKEFPNLFIEKENYKSLDLRWKEKWKYIYESLWEIPDNIKIVIEKMDIDESTDILYDMKKIIQQLESQISIQPEDIKINILNYLEKYLQKIKIVNKYYNKYKNNPKELLAMMRGINNKYVEADDIDDHVKSLISKIDITDKDFDINNLYEQLCSKIKLVNMDNLNEDDIKKISIELLIENNLISTSEAYILDISELSQKLFNNLKWIKAENIKWWVTLEKNSTNLTFYIDNEKDFNVVWRSNINKRDVEYSCWWFSSSWSKIPELKYTLNVVNWTREGDYQKITRKHENIHSENKIFMPDYNSLDMLSEAKDEILARVWSWQDKKETIEWMSKVWDWSLYDWYEKYRKKWYVYSHKYESLRKLYEQELLYIIEIAYAMKKLEVPNYLDILRFTPVRKWRYLKKVFLE